jgi:Fungal chitosanase of glycosyl hydrolase group 75
MIVNYHPPADSLSRLGAITGRLESATRINHAFRKGGKVIFKLEGGELYYDSLLDLDSDGSRWATQDATGQTDTSLHQPDGGPVDSDAVPFFVLPGRGFYQQFGIRLGDIAAVIYRDKIEFAVFADHGPASKLGEGSIALHRSLGHETIRGGRFHDEAIDANVITIVFPGSGDGTPQTPERIRSTGRQLFTGLGGSA